MTRALCLAFLLTCRASPLVAERPDPDARFQQAIALYDAGKPEEAIAIYRELLADDAKNPLYRYELALSLGAAGRPDECASTAEGALDAAPKKLHTELLTLAANCFDQAGQAAKALPLYAQADRESPGNGDILFNWAVAHLGQKHRDEAQRLFERAVVARPTHPGSHYWLHRMAREDGRRASAILSGLRFLSLEPTGMRAVDAAKSVVALLGHGVTQTADDKVEVKVSPTAATDDLGALDFFISLSAAVAFTEDQKDLSEVEKLAKQIESALAYVSDLRANVPDESAPFELRYYFPLFADLHERGLSDALTYRALTTLDLPGAEAWRAEHVKELDAFDRWLKGKSPSAGPGSGP